MKTQHTPGPWFQHHSPDSVRVCNGKHDSDEGCIMIAEAEIIGYERSESEANARLVAAAPEMLVALEKALHRLERIEGFGCPQDILNEMHAAIRKARGEQ